jgi:hypothetical protein
MTIVWFHRPAQEFRNLPSLRTLTQVQVIAIRRHHSCTCNLSILLRPKLWILGIPLLTIFRPQGASCPRVKEAQLNFMVGHQKSPVSIAGPTDKYQSIPKPYYYSLSIMPHVLAISAGIVTFDTWEGCQASHLHK